eukprot:scaffold55230_cov16-Tisochrysis_lutea.AAC.1
MSWEAVCGLLHEQKNEQELGGLRELQRLINEQDLRGDDDDDAKEGCCKEWHARCRSERVCKLRAKMRGQLFVQHE